MVSPKSTLLFLSGCAAGVIITAALLNPSVRAHAGPINAGPFVDVPTNHVAAKAVADLKSKGIVTGYADDTYHGAQPVTRYELAVTLDRFARYYDRSTQPLASNRIPLPVSPPWASGSREYLASNKYISADSPLFRNPGKTAVTADQLAAGLSSIYDRIADRSLPPTEQQ